MNSRAKQKAEFGDFQTPAELALRAVSILTGLHIHPASLVEPTCGTGSFLLAAAKGFPATQIVGLEISDIHLSQLKEQILSRGLQNRVQLLQEDFFAANWTDILQRLPAPLLIVGNPPWVTNAELGILQSDNLPLKSNFRGHRGYDAITGKSNFDISEWMLLKYLEWLDGRQGVIAVLCKTAVARKVLLHAWRNELQVSFAKLYLIDTRKYFNASVDACFLVIGMLGGEASFECTTYTNIEAPSQARTIGFHDGMVLADVNLYRQRAHLRGVDHAYRWRSGIKHDCSNVMELQRLGTAYINATGEVFSLEDHYVYPMLKSSDVGNGKTRYGRRYMLVPQRYVGDDTSAIRVLAPLTWQYLERHQSLLSNRASTIYKKHPQYSIFGVGPYSFAPWKVAISGFYKNLNFKVIEPFEDKPVVLDDTVYFLPCATGTEASFLCQLLSSKPAQEFYESMIFWSDKRPITIEVLQRLDLHKVSIQLNLESQYLEHIAGGQKPESERKKQAQAAADIDRFREKYGGWDGTAEVLKWRGQSCAAQATGADSPLRSE